MPYSALLSPVALAAALMTSAPAFGFSGEGKVILVGFCGSDHLAALLVLASDDEQRPPPGKAGCHAALCSRERLSGRRRRGF